jgi:quinol monooxygenase YgiN
MQNGRRQFIATAGAAAVGVAMFPALAEQKGQAMYGLIGKVITAPGQREAFIGILLEGIGGMPGCLSYIVSKDQGDENAIWITEVWDTKASHQASLALPAVKAAIAKGRPMIVAFGDRVETTPVGGQGLPAAGPR